MTITRHWAEVKNAVYGTRTSTGTADAAWPLKLHYEFLSAAATPSAAFSLWAGLARPGQAIKLVVSAGNEASATKAAMAAKRMNVDMPSGRAYQVGDVVAEMRIPSDGVSILRTSNISSNMAQALRESMPFALPFESVKWFPPGMANKFPLKRVPYACSSFGMSIPEAVACKQYGRCYA